TAVFNVVANAAGAASPFSIQRFLPYAAPSVYSAVDANMQDGDVLDTGQLESVGISYEALLGELDDKASPNSIANPNNWKLEKDGLDISELIDSISAEYRESIGATVATLELAQPLLKGTYRVTVRDSVRDQFG